MLVKQKKTLIIQELTSIILLSKNIVWMIRKKMVIKKKEFFSISFSSFREREFTNSDSAGKKPGKFKEDHDFSEQKYRKRQECFRKGSEC